MNVKLGGIEAAFALTLILWGTGFWQQKVYNTVNANDYSFNTKHFWIYCLGMRPGVDRVYLRPAYVQILALLYLIASIGWVMSSYSLEVLWDLTKNLVGIGLLIGGGFWLIIDRVIK